MKAREIMTADPIFIGSSETARNAMEMFYEHDFRHLPVVDEGELVGMLSSRDLQSSIVPVGPETWDFDAISKSLDKKISELMRTDLLYVSPDTEVTEVIELMTQNRIGAVPVVDSASGKLEGIISYVDVLNALKSAAAT